MNEIQENNTEEIYTDEEMKNIAEFIDVLRSIQKRLLSEGHTMEDIRKAWRERKKLV